MRIVLPIHFRLVDVGQGYLSPVPAAHKGAKHLEFTEMLLQDCHTRLFCEYPSCCTPCCLRLGIPVWQEGPRSACWLPETHRHSKHTVQVPHQLQQQHWESAAPRYGGHCSNRTSLIKTRVHLWRSNFYLTSITKTQAMTGLNSPQHTYHDPCCFSWAGWLRSMPSANSRVRHCTASPELAEGICSKLEAQLQWHLTNDPMQGALPLFPGCYPDWQGARNLKNRRLWLLCHCVFNGFRQERRWKGRALRLGPAALGGSCPCPGSSCSVPFLKDTTQSPAPRPDAQLGTAAANWVTTRILQHARARFSPAFGKYWFRIFSIKKLIKRQLKTNTP